MKIRIPMKISRITVVAMCIIYLHLLYSSYNNYYILTILSILGANDSSGVPVAAIGGAVGGLVVAGIVVTIIIILIVICIRRKKSEIPCISLLL